MRYTFGIDKTAEKRLQKLAEVFNPYSLEFIRKYAWRPAAAALDLGCGPGFSTQMLHVATRAKEVYGMDSSENFLAAAIGRFKGQVFIRHDVTSTPFLVRPDVMYARFVLAHIPGPAEMLNRWAGELADSGVLLVEETEDIRTGIGVFKRYLEVNRGLVASEGARLFAGKALSGCRYDAEVVANETVRISVANSDAAELFYLNAVNVWEKEAYVKERVPAGERKEIASELQRIIGEKDGRGEAVWVIRRVVLRKKSRDPYRWLFI